LFQNLKLEMISKICLFNDCNVSCVVINVVFICISVASLVKKLGMALKRIECLRLRLKRARFDSRMKMKIKYSLRKRF